MSEIKSENKHENKHENEIKSVYQNIFESLTKDCRTERDLFVNLLNNKYLSRLIGNYASVDTCFDLVQDSCRHRVDITQVFLGAIEKDRVDVVDSLSEWENGPELMRECLEFAKENNCCQKMIELLELMQD